MTVPVESFRNLSRSSPWKWQSLRFELRWIPATGQPPATAAEPEQKPEPVLEPAAPDESPADEPVRCWLRRPQALRVERPDGALLYSTTGINDSKDSLFISGTRKPWLLPARLVTPVYDDAGLVRRRPEADYGSPAFGDRRLAAILDPVEIAGNAPVPLDFPFANLVELSGIAEVEHKGRPALEAVAEPNAHYRPRSADGPLLFPGRTLLRIDLATAVCVASTSLDGESRGAGHRLDILGVDEYMLDDLFLEKDFGLTDVRRHISWDLPAG
jgi:hypothetical protein